jgi:CD177 antigen
MVLTKGCTRDMNKKARLTRHRTGPGISIVSYVHVCRDRDFCNDLSTTDPLWTPPPDTGTRGGKSLEKGKGLSEGNTGL